MYRVSSPQSLASRCLKVGLSISIVALVAACSSASTRFGPFDNTQASSDPGYNPDNPNSVHTGSLSDEETDGNNFDRDVAAQPLDDPTRPASHTVAAPAGNGSVVVRQGDTLYSISRQHGASVGDLIAINNLQPPYEIKSGQSLVLPGGTDRTHMADNRQPTISPVGAIAQTSVPGMHKVKSGQTLYSISRAYGHNPDTVAAHNQIDAPFTLKVGQSLRIPDRGNLMNASYTPPAAPRSDNTPQRIPAEPQATITPVTPSAPAPTPKANPLPQSNPAVPQMTSSKFRWPVKGRIISQYGSKPEGGRNDGINVAVPEGTSVKASENGVVAYAGNELKGYGNLVLIRHENNWVTAYAHNKELFVRRGDTVKRGQIIAKAGTTGSVTTPQLHFEIRKGAQAVDPLKYLSPNTLAGG